MELADSQYRDRFRMLGNRLGLDAGDITITLASGASVTVSTTDTSWAGDLGLFTRLPDGRAAFYPAASVISVEDTAPGS